MPRKGHSSPYKGVPKSQWSALKMGEHPSQNAATPLSTTDNMMSDAASTPPDVLVRRETITPSGAPQGAVPATAGPSIPAAPTDIPINLFGGDQPKLVVYGKTGDPKDPIPGFRTYWFSDMNGSGVRIGQAQRSGWEFVKKDEILMTDELVPANKDLGDHVRYIVEQRGPTPVYGYLMKKPKWLDDAHMREREEKVNQRIEDSLKQGRVSTNPADKQYAGGQPGSSLPPINITSGTYR